MQDPVTVVGYPIGGETISVTSGVVSRVEVRLKVLCTAAHPPTNHIHAHSRKTHCREPSATMRIELLSCVMYDDKLLCGGLFKVVCPRIVSRLTVL